MPLLCTQQGRRRRALLSSTPRPGIIGKDDRALVRSRAYPYSAVVRIAYKKDRSTVAQCTGSFVSDKVLLTSAACVYNNDPSVRAFYDLDLITLYDSSKRRLNATVASVIVDDLYMLGVLSSDVALIVLESPIDLAAQYRVLGLSKECSPPPAGANRPSLLGYPRTWLRTCVRTRGACLLAYWGVGGGAELWAGSLNSAVVNACIAPPPPPLQKRVSPAVYLHPLS
jgi:hypothetical protein